MKILSAILIGSWLATSAIAFANGEVGAPASPVTSETANDDLSQTKAADALFEEYEKVAGKAFNLSPNAYTSTYENPSTPKENAAQRADEIYAKFLKLYPNDPRRWKMRFQKVYYETHREGIRSMQYTEFFPIADAPDVDAETKRQAVFALADHFAVYELAETRGIPFSHFKHQTRKEFYADWEKQFAILLKKYPGVLSDDQQNLLRAGELAQFDRKDARVIMQDLVKTAKDPAIAHQAFAWLNPEESRKLEYEKELKRLQTAPMELKFTAIDGRKVDLAKWREKVVAIDLWATWYNFYPKQMARNVAIYKKLHAKGFEMVGLSIDEDKSKGSCKDI